MENLTQNMELSKNTKLNDLYNYAIEASKDKSHNRGYFYCEIGYGKYFTGSEVEKALQSKMIDVCPINSDFSKHFSRKSGVVFIYPTTKLFTRAGRKEEQDKISEKVKENFTKFEDIVNEIHAISDNEGMTKEEYSKWDTLRGKANKIK